MSFLDLQDGLKLETDEKYVSSEYHSAYIFVSKAEEMVLDHVTTYGTDQPFFLYYALQLVHFPYIAPSVYTDRCIATTGDDVTDSDYIQYCGLNLMLDEAVANISCTLSTAGVLDNTVIVLASDNGGNDAIAGSSYPYRGYKWDQYRGGLSVSAFIFSPLLDDSVKGSSYYGQMHVTGR
jgi:arylsulfatase B